MHSVSLPASRPVEFSASAESVPEKGFPRMSYAPKSKVGSGLGPASLGVHACGFAASSRVAPLVLSRGELPVWLPPATYPLTFCTRRVTPHGIPDLVVLTIYLTRAKDRGLLASHRLSLRLSGFWRRQASDNVWRVYPRRSLQETSSGFASQDPQDLWAVRELEGVSLLESTTANTEPPYHTTPENLHTTCPKLSTSSRPQCFNTRTETTLLAESEHS